MNRQKNKKNRDLWLGEKIKQIPAGSRILDAGAGELQNKPLCSHLDYVSQDFGQFTGNNPNAPGLGNDEQWDTSQIDLVCDITDIPEPKESFDAVLCSEVFEHIPDPIAALKELARLLKPNGKLLLTAPFNSLTHQAPYFFYSGYSRFFYEYWCKEFSLAILELTQNGNYYDYLAQELQRLNSVGQKYSKVKMPIMIRVSKWIILQFLIKCSIRNKGSEELLCFGYHLLAEKKQPK